MLQRPLHRLLFSFFSSLVSLLTPPGLASVAPPVGAWTSHDNGQQLCVQHPLFKENRTDFTWAKPALNDQEVILKIENQALWLFDFNAQSAAPLSIPGVIWQTPCSFASPDGRFIFGFGRQELAPDDAAGEMRKERAQELADAGENFLFCGHNMPLGPSYIYDREKKVFLHSVPTTIASRSSKTVTFSESGTASFLANGKQVVIDLKQDKVVSDVAPAALESSAGANAARLLFSLALSLPDEPTHYRAIFRPAAAVQQLVFLNTWDFSLGVIEVPSKKILGSYKINELFTEEVEASRVPLLFKASPSGKSIFVKGDADSALCRQTLP